MNEIGGVYRSQTNQWLAASSATLAMLHVGFEHFWLMNTMNNVRNADFWTKSTRYSNWAGFYVAVTSSVIGAILGGVLAERFGRKKILLATSIFAISQTVGSLSTNGVISCITLFLGETGLGITRVVVPLYVSEIVDDNIRGALLMLQMPFLYFGKLIALVIHDPISIKGLGVASLISTGIFLLTFSRFPETPYYLASKNRDEAANRSLAFFRGVGSVAAEDDVEAIVKKFEITGDSQNVNGKFRELLQPTNRKALIIIMLLIFVQWSDQIFESQNAMAYVIMGWMVSNENHAYIIAHVTSLIASILIVLIIDIIGRRSLLSYSTLTGLILLILSIIFKGSSNHYEWIYNAIGMILHLCILVVFSIPLVYAGELFSPNVKALGLTIVTIFNLFINFVIIILLEKNHMSVNAIIDLILISIAFPITYAFSPETKQKSYSDIQKELAITSHCRCMQRKSTPTDQS